MLAQLGAIARGAGSWIELRYHARRAKRLSVRNGSLEESSSVELVGIGVRALVEGVLGFASTADLSGEGIRAAVAAAQGAARVAGPSKRARICGLGEIPLMQGTFSVQVEDPLDDHPLEEKMALIRRIDERIRRASPRVVSSSVSYSEIQDEKVIVTSDGVAVHVLDSKPDFRAMAVASRDGDQTMGMDSVQATGGWTALFSSRSPEAMADSAARLAVDQLTAPHATGGTATVVLDPGLVGVLCHEAIGHTVEADIVLGGAVTAGKIGQRVASEQVMLCDSGVSEHRPHAGGELAVDDEGVAAGRTVIIEGGILRSFLHNRESAVHFGAAPTGNARAYEYSDEPIIRMRNTYLEPGEADPEGLIESVEDGYLLQGLGLSGQADSNAEFMFGVREAHRIQDGKVGEMVRGVTISGNAFDVLMSVDGVGNDFAWGLGAGLCGKGQAAKVDAGGPHIRCVVTIGGRQG